MHSLPDNQGLLIQPTFANPGVGTNITLAHPTNSRRRFIAVSFNFITGAGIATRQVKFAIIQNSQIVAVVKAQATQITALTRTYYFIAGGKDLTAFIGTELETAVPLDLLQNESSQIQISADNIDATDEFQSIFFYFEEWKED